MRADAMLEAGDLDGLAVWKRILKAVEELQGTVPKSGVVVPASRSAQQPFFVRRRGLCTPNHC